MRYMLLLLMSCAIVACGNVEPVNENAGGGQPDGRTVLELVVGGSGKTYGTRSILTDSNIETDVRSVTLAAYDAYGVLADVKHYGSDLSSLCLQLIPGMSYNVYALANMGDMSGKFPLREEELPSVEYELSSFDEIAVDGIPMCGDANVKAGTEEDVIRMERLFAKVCVRIMHGRLYNANPDMVFAYNMCNKSIYMRQANRRLAPFSVAGSKAAKASDVMDVSDYNMNMNDRGAYEGSLSMGELGPGPGYFQDTTFVFYVPENVQGELLPDNDDPFGKVNGNIDGIDGKPYGDLCTYVEFNAKRELTQGYGGSVMYKCYLGADNTSDFSVRRNCRYDMTLDFSEGGFFLDSWKVTRGDDWTDNRCLRFIDKSYTINPGESRNVMVHFHQNTSSETHSQLYPERWKYIIDEEAMAAAGLTVSFDPNTLVAGTKYNDFCLVVTASADAAVGASFPMTVMTTDGSIVDHAVISVVPESELTVDWDFCPEYVSQYGNFTVIGYDDGDLPLSYSVSDESKVKCSRRDDGTFDVVALGTGESSVTISGADGKKSVTAYLNVWAPELKLDSKKIVLNPDGEYVPVSYEYLTMSGEPLEFIDPDSFASILKPLIPESEYFSSVVSEDAVELFVNKLEYGDSQIVVGGMYSVEAVACNCDEVVPQSLKIQVSDPFEGITVRDYGAIDDYTLFALGDASTGLGEEFADEISANRTFSYPGPVPAADPSCVGVELVPRWSGGFSNANDVYSATWNPSGGSIFVRQNSVTSSTSHSAGRHDMFIYVKNRHSGERLRRECGLLDIYVHTAIGAEAVFGKQDCGYRLSPSGKSFADVYNKVAGRNLYQDPTSTQDINYMDVTMKWLTPVSKVHVLNMASVPNDSYDGLKFIKPSVADGQQRDGQLFSVCQLGGDDRITVCGEPSGSRAGVGRVLYRSLLLQTYDRVLSNANLHEFFFNYKGAASGLFAPAYKIADTAGFKDGAYYFSPSSCSEYVDEDGNGYHVIHFLDKIYPETAGWTNLIK